MVRSNKVEVIWSVGLAKELKQKLIRLLGKKYQLVSWEYGTIPPLSDYEALRPKVAIFSPEGMKFIKSCPENSIRHLELLPKVLLLSEGYGQKELEFAIDEGVSEVIRPPYKTARIMDKIRRAREIEAVQDDVLRMSKEIIMEREILERKNDILNFLVNFLTSTSTSTNPQEVLQLVFEKLQLLFPVRAVQAALWSTETDSDRVDVYMSVPETATSNDGWMAKINETLASACQHKTPDINIHRLEYLAKDDHWLLAGPNEGHIIKLPLSMNNQQFGFILVLTDMARSLSRDQALALSSALQHLALTLKNARNFQTMKHYADYDGLTGVHNRRHFDVRLQDEVTRYQRYAQALSLLMLDIDHFKNINDTNGHRAGDAVLQQVAAIIMQTLRSSDYAARYGGEEFAILLPYTNGGQAMKMAERLRENVNNHEFQTEAGQLHITISIGVADMDRLPAKNSDSLVREADDTLYQAKRAGRNRCIQSGDKVSKLAI